MTSEEIATAAADLATVQQLRQEIATAQTVIEGLQRVLKAVQAERDQGQTERDYWRVQAQDALTELHAVEAARNRAEAELREQLRIADLEIAAYAERADAAQQELDRVGPIVIAAVALVETIRGDGNGRCWCRAHEADMLRGALEKAKLL